MAAAIGQPGMSADSLHRRRAAELIGASSIEISPREALTENGLRELLAPGTTVFVNHPASVTHHDIVAACARLRHAGFVPVPSVAARRLASFTQARDFLQRAATEAEVKSVLIIGGDPDRPVGPFGDSFDLMTTGLVEQSGIREIVLAGYPEGHPGIDPRALADALRAKIALAGERGLAGSVITQFAFDADPIRRWIISLRAQRIVCPVRIGVAGPASIATLAKFAVRCGIGASLHALGRGHAAFARIQVEAGPDELIDALVAEEGQNAPIDGLHLFTFGGLRRIAEWIRAQTGRDAV